MVRVQLDDLLVDVAGCKLCASDLPLGPRPVVVANPKARLLIVGQAPGLKVHQTGIPWNDPSGVRLRSWLQMTESQFYDEQVVAIMPMGFCYPGRGAAGDMPPRKECAPKWHEDLLSGMPEIRLTLLVGQYAQHYYLRDRSVTLTQRVSDYDRFPGIFPLPHPSPRNNLWFSRNPWFELEVLPALRKEVSRCL